MGDYEHSATIRTSPEALYAYVADVNNLPDYFDGMVSAATTGPETVHVVAEVEGHRREGEAWMRTDEQARTVRWGAEGEHQYHGELRLDDAGNGDTLLTVTLHTERADGPGIHAGLEQSLAAIKRQIEGRSTEPR